MKPKRNTCNSPHLYGVGVLLRCGQIQCTKRWTYFFCFVTVVNDHNNFYFEKLNNVIVISSNHCLFYVCRSRIMNPVGCSTSVLTIIKFSQHIMILSKISCVISNMAFQVLKILIGALLKLIFFKCLQVSDLGVHAVHLPFWFLRKPQLRPIRVEPYFKEAVTINMTWRMISTLVIRRSKIILYKCYYYFSLTV